jgi:hypothetical protein
VVHDAPTLASAPHFKNTSGPATSPGYAIYCSGLPEALPNHIACGGASFSTAAAGVSVCVTSTFNRVLGPPQLTFNCAAARPRALGRTLKHGLAKARGRATHSKTRGRCARWQLHAPHFRLQLKMFFNLMKRWCCKQRHHHSTHHLTHHSLTGRIPRVATPPSPCFGVIPPYGAAPRRRGGTPSARGPKFHIFWSSEHTRTPAATANGTAT